MGGMSTNKHPTPIAKFQYNDFVALIPELHWFQVTMHLETRTNPVCYICPQALVSTQLYLSSECHYSFRMPLFFQNSSYFVFWDQLLTKQIMLLAVQQHACIYISLIVIQYFLHKDFINTCTYSLRLYSTTKLYPNLQPWFIEVQKYVHSCVHVYTIVQYSIHRQ